MNRKAALCLAISWFALLSMGLPLAAQNTLAIVNGASFDPIFPVSPGSLASAFGSIPGAQAAHADSLPLPTTLGDVQLNVNNAPVPLLYTSESQINFQVPQGLEVGPHEVRVTVGGAEVATGRLVIISAAPGIFQNPNLPSHAGAVLNLDGVTPNGPDHPAAPGSTIVVFGTGIGPLDGELEDGVAAPGVGPGEANRVGVSETKAYVASVETAVSFSGLTGGFVGLWQVNVPLPDESFISGPVPLFLTQGGLASNAVTVWVAEQ